MRDLIEFINANAGVIGLVFSFVVTLSTVVYAYLTWKLTKETRMMRRIQSDPIVTVFADINKNNFGAIDIVCKNEGLGAARDISFQYRINSSNENKATKLVSDGISKLGFVSHGIPQLYSGQEIRSFVTTVYGVFDDLVDVSVSFSVKYKSIGGELFSSDYVVSFKHFDRITQLSDSSMKDVSKEIAKVNSNLSMMLSNDFYVNVVMTTPEEIKQRAIDDYNRLYPEDNEDK